MRKLPALTAAVAVGLLANGASALESFALNRYEPTPLANDWLRVERPTGLPHLGLGAVVTGDYAHRPLVLIRESSDGTRGRVQDVVGTQFWVTPGLAFGLFDRVTVHAAVPFVAYQEGSGLEPRNSLAAPSTTVLGDVRLGARARIFGNTEATADRKADLFGFAVGSYLWLPTGDQASWASDGMVRGQPTLIAEVVPAENIYLTANLGFVFRPVRSTRTSATGAETVLAIAGGVKLLDNKLRLGGELSAGTGLRDDTLFKRGTTPLDGLVSGTFQIGGGLYTSLGFGGGILPAAGSPAARVVLRIGWASPWPEAPKPLPPPPPPPADTDKDSVLDKDDACVTQPGIKTNDPATNGCPDTDKDSIVDPQDACPNVAGPKTDDPKTNGCPPPVPPPDQDKDGIFDTDDACPDVPGEKNTDPKKHGCPPDRDNDGVYDKDDACPDDPGPKTADPATNGCPVKTKFATVKGSSIVISDKVNFATNSDKIIGKTSFDVLDSVFEILDKTPSIKKVRIEGHTDDRGKPEYNKDLSKRRAESVRAYLTKKGLDAGRLDSEGVGLERPISDNKTEVGRAKNRRVEFVIVTEP